MRFLPDGPALPDDLLAARDAGQVIFFCGAGVSMARAGLPDFPTLAAKVIDGLGSTRRSPARRLFAASKHEKIEGVGGLVPADRIFSLLEREFEVVDVRAEVARALKPAAGVDLSAHRTLLDLSRGPDGRTCIVTTNFDPLFQAAGRRLPIHTAPTLPNPHRPQDLQGIIHLHGRVNSDYSGPQDDEFVLSSADFGRAYLSDGWATHFIQGLMEGYQLVFLGYSAEDPPVQYLLEALSERALARSGLFAFQAGAPDEAHALWRSRGVRAIPYDPTNRHAALWKTLEAWAARARDPDAWESKVLRQAKRGPVALAPHERGWVRHLAMFPSSSRRIAEAKLPAEWICTFDPAVRYGTPEPTYREGPGFDPFEAYGLDDDTPPPAEEAQGPLGRRNIPAEAWDAFAPSLWDGHSASPLVGGRLRGPAAADASELTPRLQHLSQWIVAVAEQPATAWWASGQRNLHPSLLRGVLARLEQTDADGDVHAAWRRIAESWIDRPRTLFRHHHDLAAAVKRSGWTSAALRGLEELLQPIVKVGQPYSAARRPPRKRRPSRSELLHLDVEHPHVAEPLVLTDAILIPALGIMRRALERGQDLVSHELGYNVHPLPPITADPDVVGGGYDRTHGLAPLFFQYLDAFRRLLALDPDAAARESQSWRSGDATFDRLRIWAAGNAQATTPEVAASLLINLDDDAFWDPRQQRDLLLSLRDRWADLPRAAQRTLEGRILRGRHRWHREAREYYARGRAISSLERLSWLEAQGCVLGHTVQKARPRLRAAATDYEPGDGQRAAQSLESRGGAVRTITDASALIETAPAHLLDRARELAEARDWGALAERRPLVGLAELRPSRLFAALRFAASAGEFPEWAWRTLVGSDAPALKRPRGRRLVAERLAALSPDHLAALIHDATRWMETEGEALSTEAPGSYDRLWAALMDTLRTVPESARSAIRSSRPDWVMHAINSPSGHLADALMRAPARQSEEGKGYDPAWLAKVTELLALPGDGGRFAAVVFLQNVSWFFHHDPPWTEQHLLALRQSDDRDRGAFWAGTLRGGVPPRALYDAIKAEMLELAGDAAEGSERSDALAGWILAGWMTPEDAPEGVCIADDELRDALVAGSSGFRRRALWQLERWMNGDDGEHRLQARVLRLMQQVWPRQRVARD